MKARPRFFQRNSMLLLCAAAAMACSGQGGGSGPPLEELSPEELARHHTAQWWKMKPEQIEARDISVDLPAGMTLVGVYETPGSPHSENSIGIVQGVEFIQGWSSTTKLVFDAWNYGPERTVSATTFASVIGRLQSSQSNMKPLVKGRIPTSPKHIALPVETMHDGLPAVVYWAHDSENPYRRMTVVVHPDRRAELIVHDEFEVAREHEER